jgi:hypothetical protein
MSAVHDRLLLSVGFGFGVITLLDVVTRVQPQAANNGC